MATHQKTLGNKGEDIAVRYLESKGYRLIQTQYHAPGGEIDLVMKDNTDEWVFLEVKTRSSNRYGTSGESVSVSKLKKMMKAIEHYFLRHQELNMIPYYQIEVVLIDKNTENMDIRHIQDNIFPEDFSF